MYRIATNIRSVHSREGAVVLDVLHGQMLHLNPVGSRILELIKLRTLEPVIVVTIAHEFNVPCSAIEADVRDFLLQLEVRKMIEPD